MRAIMGAVAAAVLLAACGGSSTGPQGVPQQFTITVTDSGFSPDSLTVPLNSQVTWSVTQGTHNITFTGNVPTGSNPSSGDIAAGGQVQATFLQAGRFPFDDALMSSHTGVIIAH